MSRRMQPQPRAGRTGHRRGERGMTMLVVLVLLSVLLLGALSLAQLTAAGTLVGGNVASKERALQLSEVGVNDAFAALQALADEESNAGTWYYAQAGATDGAGLPQAINLDTAGVSRTVDGYTVRYVAERLCSTAPATEPARQCLLSQAQPRIANAKAGEEAAEPVSARQFRITVTVTGPKGTRTVVQALATRGSS